MKVSEFPIRLNHKTILSFINCRENSPQYDEFNEEIDNLEPEITKRIHPEAVFVFCKIDAEYSTETLPEGTPVICVLTTVGRDISDYASEFFSDGDCVGGMIVDAAADYFLFQMERYMQDLIKAECAVRRVGISEKLLVPNDLPFKTQRMILEKTNGYKEMNISIKDSFMLTPVKSTTYIYKLTDDETLFKTQHDCRKCTYLDCNLRNVTP